MKIHLPVSSFATCPMSGISTVRVPRGGWRREDPGGPGTSAGAGHTNGGEAGATTDQDVSDDLGEAGKKAIDRMKAERNAARNELRGVKEQLDKLAPLQKLADALGGQPTGDGTTDLEALTQRLGQHETELANERLARFRVEVASEKGLTPAQAKRLVGKTRDELAADADEILRDFPVAPAGDQRIRSGALRPDPSQGSRGGGALSGKEAGLAEAQKRFGKPATPITR